jgi:hypothetical protein
MMLRLRVYHRRTRRAAHRAEQLVHLDAVALATRLQPALDGTYRRLHADRHVGEVRHRRPHRIPSHLSVGHTSGGLLVDKRLSDLDQRLLLATDDLVDQVENAPPGVHREQRGPDVFDRCGHGIDARQHELAPLGDGQQRRRLDGAIQVDVELDAGVEAVAGGGAGALAHPLGGHRGTGRPCQDGASTPGLYSLT